MASPQKCVRDLLHINAKSKQDNLYRSSSEEERKDHHISFQISTLHQEDYVIVAFAHKHSVIWYHQGRNI